jgi:hypothetical protein
MVARRTMVSMSVTFLGSPTGPVQWQLGKGGDGFYARIDPVGTGSSLRYWQGNNSGALNRCVSNCSAPFASWSFWSGGWYGSDQQSFILPYDIFHGGIPEETIADPLGATTGCGHLIVGTTRVWEPSWAQQTRTAGTLQITLPRATRS